MSKQLKPVNDSEFVEVFQSQQDFPRIESDAVLVKQLPIVYKRE